MQPWRAALGQKRRFDRRLVNSGLPHMADIFRVRRHVSKVPIADILRLIPFFPQPHAAAGAATVP
jgi:hypothetical protein